MEWAVCLSVCLSVVHPSLAFHILDISSIEQKLYVRPLGQHRDSELLNMFQ